MATLDPVTVNPQTALKTTTNKKEVTATMMVRMATLPPVMMDPVLMNPQTRMDLMVHHLTMMVTRRRRSKQVSQLFCHHSLAVCKVMFAITLVTVTKQTISMDAWTANQNYRPGGSRFVGSVENDFHPRIFGSVCSSPISSKSDWSNTPIHFKILSYVVIPPRYIQCMHGRLQGNCQI
jgi:hypothetical protein